MTKRSLVAPLSVFILILGICLPATAQRHTASVRGTVTDGSGAVIPGATATLKGEETGLVRISVTNESGIYTFSDVPGGIYNHLCGTRRF